MSSLLPNTPTDVTSESDEWPLLSTCATACRIEACSSRLNDLQAWSKKCAIFFPISTRPHIINGATFACPTTWKDVLLARLLATQDICLRRRSSPQRIRIRVALHSHNQLECIRHIHSDRRCRSNITDLEPREDKCEELNRATHTRCPS